MQEAQTWRTLLGIITTTSKEKQRIIDELAITPITLTRWIHGESNPRLQNVQHLVNVLPHYREQLLDLLKEDAELAEFSHLIQDDSPKEIPTEFYEEVFITQTSTVGNIRFWSLCHLILEHALMQLDPQSQGMCIWVVRCMPPSGPFKKVQSLRETIGRGTTPWMGDLEQTAQFLGAQSLAGNVVTLCHPAVIQNLDQEQPGVSVTRIQDEHSVAIYPILYAGRIAGVFMVSSKRYNYFLPQARTELVQRYTELMALAFEPEDFYASEDIALSLVPQAEEQKEYFAKHFHQTLLETMQAAASSGRPLGNREIDQRVWQKFEEDLLQMAPHSEEV